MRVRPVLVTAVAGLLAVAPARAQFAPGARATGMAGAGLVFASGIDAAELNPANLGGATGWHLSIFEFGASGVLTGTSIGDFRDIVSAAGDGDAALVSRLPDEGFTIEAASEGFGVATAIKVIPTDAALPQPGSPYPSVGLAFGPFALRVRSQILATGSISKEVADLTVTGFQPERLQEYAVRNTSFRVASFSEITLAYGHRLEAVSLGVAVRRVQGHKLSQVRLFEPEIDLNTQTFQLTGIAVEAPGGAGFGVDLGMTVDAGPGFRWSLAMENVLQRMSWQRVLRAHEGVFTDADFDSADIDVLIDRFAVSELDPQAVSLPVFEAARGLYDESYFPTVIRTGVGWAAGGTRVEVVGTRVAPRGRQRSSWDQRLSFGVEQKLLFLRLRGGFARGDDGLSAIAGGVDVALGPVSLEAGVGSISGTRPGDLAFEGVHGTLALSVRRGGS